MVKLGVNLLNIQQIREDRETAFDICSGILAVDPMVAEAVRTKMKIHIDDGHHGLALQVFEAFQREYRSVFAKQYEASIDEFLASPNP